MGFIIVTAGLSVLLLIIAFGSYLCIKFFFNNKERKLIKLIKSEIENGMGRFSYGSSSQSCTTYSEFRTSMGFIEFYLDPLGSYEISWDMDESYSIDKLYVALNLHKWARYK